MFAIHSPQDGEEGVVMIDWALVLSIIGAAAWVPIIATPVINLFRNVSAILIDSRILTNGTGVSAEKKEKKNGTILILFINVHIKNVDFFPTDISAKIKLMSGAISNAVLLDCSTVVSNNEKGRRIIFTFPHDMEWNVYRTIHGNADNIKAVAFLAENAAFQQLQDIDEIEIILHKDKLLRKTIKIRHSQFPK